MFHWSEMVSGNFKVILLGVGGKVIARDWQEPKTERAWLCLGTYGGIINQVYL